MTAGLVNGIEARLFVLWHLRQEGSRAVLPNGVKTQFSTAGMSPCRAKHANRFQNRSFPGHGTHLVPTAGNHQFVALCRTQKCSLVFLVASAGVPEFPEESETP